MLYSLELKVPVIKLPNGAFSKKEVKFSELKEDLRLVLKFTCIVLSDNSFILYLLDLYFTCIHCNDRNIRQLKDRVKGK